MADAILCALGDRNNHYHPPASAFATHILEFDVDVTVVLIPLAHGIQVLLKLRLLQASRLVEEVDQGLSFRLHLLAQRGIAKSSIALKTNAADRAFLAFIDREDDAGSAARFIGIEAILHIDVVKSLGLVGVDDLLARLA